jgi:hypothetical protein
MRRIRLQRAIAFNIYTVCLCAGARFSLRRKGKKPYPTLRTGYLSWIPKLDCLKRRNPFNGLEQDVETAVLLCAMNSHKKNATEDTEKAFVRVFRGVFLCDRFLLRLLLFRTSELRFMRRRNPAWISFLLTSSLRELHIW